jgi:hypothetical protein
MTRAEFLAPTASELRYKEEGDDKDGGGGGGGETS